MAKEIVEMGNEFDMSKEEIIFRLQKKLNVTPEQAQEYFTMYGAKM